jgi:hypothetical protein
MESRRRNPLRRYPTAVCISVLHFGLTQPKTRALNSPGDEAMHRFETEAHQQAMPETILLWC